MALNDHRGLDQALRDTVLMVAGVTFVAEQLIVYALGGPEPFLPALILCGIWALGVPGATAVINAWKGRPDDRSNDDDGS